MLAEDVKRCKILIFMHSFSSQLPMSNAIGVRWMNENIPRIFMLFLMGKLHSVLEITMANGYHQTYFPQYHHIIIYDGFNIPSVVYQLALLYQVNQC